MDAGPDGLPEHRQILAQIQARLKFGDRLLPAGRLFPRSRRQEPRGQRIFAGASASRAKQLEKRSLPENVEIFFVNVRWIAEALARLPGADPLIFQAGQAALVESDCAPSTLQLLHHSGVDV